ncbi:YfhO family protein [candidate division TA06 bacterium]|uniref:YfhO family protein n=1 Tax=candidate division TA06 bacterium TaxID=2250710 RepID=A0A933IDH5_UNCT6|nr:YfhO family protein [candidate division TA06 bacterium]
MKKNRNPKPNPVQQIPELPGRDYLNNPWLASGFLFALALVMFNRALLSKFMIFGTDFVTGAYMSRAFAADVITRLHQIPMWYSNVYGGVPYVDAVAGDLFYPTSLLLRLFMPAHQFTAWNYFLHIALAGIGAYLFLRNLKFGGTASLLAGITYMFTGSTASLMYAGHDAKIMVGALLPWLLLFIDKAVAGKKLLWTLCAGLAIGLALLTPHVQMSYYLLLAGFFFALARMYQNFKADKSRLNVIKTLGLGLAMLAVGFSLYAVQALPLQSYLKFSPRGQDKGYQFATSYSMPPEEIVNIVWPEFSGLIDKDSGERPTHWYWGRRDLKLHTEYIGVIPVLLALVGLIYSKRKKLKLFFIFFGAFALIVAFGGFTPLYYLVYYLIPGMSKFRSPAMIFSLFSFAAAVLAAAGVQALMDGHFNKKLFNGLLIGLGAALALGFVFTGAKDGMTSMLSGFAAQGWGAQALWNSYPEMARGFWIAFVILLLGALLVWLLAKRRMPLIWWAAIAGLLIFAELWRVDAKFMKVVSPDDYFSKDEVVQKLERDKSLYRVMPLQVHQQGNYLTLFGFQTVGGEHPNPLRRYNEFVGVSAQRLLPDFHNVLDFNGLNFMSILGAKYLLMRQPLNHPDFALYDSCYGGQVRIYQYKKALPRAWLAGNYEVIAEETKILERIKQAGFDPARTVILEESPEGVVPANQAQGSVVIDEYQPNQIKISVEALATAIMVFSENHYPAWQAYLDGQPAKIYRADYTFRAVVVPAGRHKIEFKYYSKTFNTGLTVSLISALLVILGIIGLGIREMAVAKRSKTEKTVS